MGICETCKNLCPSSEYRQSGDFLCYICENKRKEGIEKEINQAELNSRKASLLWCRRKQQKRGPGEKPEVAAPNGPRSQLPPTLEFPSPNLEVSFPAAICPEWDSGDI